jgi:uncharacterized protein YdeI (YjbR/CyaY-like superfamily)
MAKRATKRKTPGPLHIAGAGDAPAPRFFATQAAWRAWLAKNHATRAFLWVGFWRVSTGKPSINWPQSVDEALCFGWIDGLRRGLDPASYMIRFTPRKSGSKWSRVNLKRYAELLAEKKVYAAGRAARAKWKEGAQAGYSHERGHVELNATAEARLRKIPRAWAFWSAQIPSYRKMVAGWLLNPKREETRASRLETLIECCENGRAIPPIAKWVKMNPVE